MKIEVSVIDEGAPERVVELELSSAASVSELVDALAAALDEPAEQLRGLDLDPSALPEALERAPCGTRHLLRVRRTCVDIFYEGRPPLRIHVPVRAKWRAVHRRACRDLEIARDACGNLELHEDSADGEVLHENDRVGRSPKGCCRAVWLVKPGPEPYGAA